MPTIDFGQSGSILLHSGQEMLEETDLFMKGRDPMVDFAIRRRHLTGVNFTDSPFGPSWAFNYDQTLVQQPDLSLLLHGYGRTDSFANVGFVGGLQTWEGTQGRLDTATWDGAATITVYRPGGLTMTFYVEGTAGSLVGHMTALTSPAGNQLLFEYDTTAAVPLLDRNLLEITESYGRTIELITSSQGVILEIDAFDGREVGYSYDLIAGQEVLEFVNGPVTAGILGPATSKITAYEYRGHSDPRLTFALKSVTDPRGTFLAYGPRLQWTYEENPFSQTFGFVKTHTIGIPTAPADLAAGGTFSYEYEVLASSISPPHVAAIETQVTDRRGTVSTLLFNSLGQMLEERIDTHGLRPGSPQSYLRTFSYDSDGLMLSMTESMGGQTLVTYPDPDLVPRTLLDTQTVQTQTPDSRGGDQDSIVRQVVHEPLFNRPFKVVDPRGFEPGNNPEDYTTTYLYDYMENLSAAKTVYAPRLGMTESELQAVFDELGIVSLGETNNDNTTTQRAGNHIKTVYPTVPMPAQITLLGLPTQQTAVELFAYNSFGQLTKHVDEEENVHLYTYFGENDPDGDTVIDVPGGVATEGGYLRTMTEDALGGSGRNSGHNPTPAAKVTQYFYDDSNDYGVPNPRGIPTLIIDPRGIARSFLVNALDYVIEETRGQGSLRYITKTIRDYNDNIVEVQVQNKDTLDGSDDYVVYQWTYDVLDFMKSETRDVGSLEIKTQFEYDASTNLTSVHRGVDTPDLSIEESIYDERNILISVTRGVGALEQSTYSTEIDLNGNMTSLVDSSGDHDRQVFDGFDRVWETIDRAGNRSASVLDSIGNTISTEIWGPLALSQSPILLAKHSQDFDRRARQVRAHRHLFHYQGNSFGTLNDGSLDPGDGKVSGITLFDRRGRTIGSVDAESDLTTYHWDGADRLIEVIDPQGNSQAAIYDGNDNLRLLTEVEISPFIAVPEVFTTQFVFDSLDRLEELTEPNGQKTLYDYDSRDNAIRITDQLGNQIEMMYDRVDRLLESREYLSIDGLNASAANHHLAQGGGDGIITLRQSWDSLDRLRAQTDDNGNETRYTWDDLDRKIRTDYEDATFSASVFNADSELIEYTTQQGSVATFQNDSKGRALQVSVVNSDPTIVGSTFKLWRYDGLDRVWWSLDLNSAAPEDDVVVSTVYDSLGRIIRERHGVPNVPQLPLVGVISEYEGSSRLVVETYPNNARAVIRNYDSLDRVATITEGATGSPIASFQYVGPWRELSRVYGNGTVLDKRNAAGTQTIGGAQAGYDSNRRTIRHAWKRIGASVTSYVNTYNGPGGIGTNRRLSETREHLFGHTDTYAFDSAYRMLSFVRNGSSISARSLDGADKMLAFLDEGTPRNPVVDGDPAEAGLNQYSSLNGQARVYNDNGSLISDGSGLQYAYDWMNRLVSVTQAGSLVAQYTYDADNRRVLRYTSAGGYLRFLYSGWRVLEEQNPLAPTSTVRQFVEGTSIDDHIQLLDYSAGGSAQPYYYHSNEQGYVGALTNALGVPIEYYEYSWLGRPTILAADKTTQLTVSTVGNPYSFQGSRHDVETGLFYCRFRYYDPRTGEFVTIDPTGLWSHGQGNGYSAFMADPWTWLDPLGLGFLDWVQTGLDIVGLVPGVGEAADLVNAGISAARGNWVDAGSRLTSAIPGIGQASTIARVTARGGKVLFKGGDSVAAAAGRLAHEDFKRLVRAKAASTGRQWRADRSLVGLSGRRLRPDAITPSGRLIELKPNTPSGRRAGARAIRKYERELGRRVRVVYYNAEEYRAKLVVPNSFHPLSIRNPNWRAHWMPPAASAPPSLPARPVRPAFNPWICLRNQEYESRCMLPGSQQTSQEAHRRAAA